MQDIIFWDVTQCSLVEIYRRFGEMHCLHLQSEFLKKQASSKLTSSSCSLLSAGSAHFSLLQMEAVPSSETLVNFYQTADVSSLTITLFTGTVVNASNVTVS
jgi:hypothetical protein